MSTKKSHSVEINSIACSGTSESGHDEVYLVFQSDGGIPKRVPSGINEYKSMKKGDGWGFNGLVLHFEYEVLVTIMDHDMDFDPNLATYLQSHDIEAGDPSDQVKLSNRNGAKYTLTYTTLS